METEIKIKLDNERYRKSLHEFVKDAFMNTGEGEYTDGKHIQIICRALEYLYHGKIKSNNLFINVPPSHGKSLIVAVFFPLWVWAVQDSHTRWMCLSYADARAGEDSKRRRFLFNSNWYKEHFQIPLTGTGDNITRLTNIYGGSIFSSGIQSQLTGEHADFIICDDILNASDRFSEVAINKVNDIYDNVLPSRFNNPQEGKKIIICQRLTDSDIIGHILEKKEPYESIILPEIYDIPRYKSKFADLNDWRKEGDLLWEERFDASTISKIQFNMTELDVSGQYQQRPTPLAGHIFRKEWFQNRVENMDVYKRFIFADTASSLKGDYSALMCVEQTSDNYMFVRDVHRGKWEFPRLIDEIKRFVDKWKWGLEGIVIEEKSSGIQAIQTLRGILPYDVIGYQPEGAKKERAYIQSAWCEKRMVLLPPPSPAFEWLLPFEDEIFNFPNSRHDDQTDTLSMAISFFRLILEQGYAEAHPISEIPMKRDNDWADEYQVLGYDPNSELARQIRGGM